MNNMRLHGLLLKESADGLTACEKLELDTLQAQMRAEMAPRNDEKELYGRMTAGEKGALLRELYRTSVLQEGDLIWRSGWRS